MPKFVSFKTFWKDSSLVLKIFTFIDIYSLISTVWSLLSTSGYIANLKPFGGIENIFLKTLTFLFGIISTLLFLSAVFTKSKRFFYIHLYSSIIYVPILFFMTWWNVGINSQIGIFYLIFLPIVGLLIWLTYLQRNYFTK